MLCKTKEQEHDSSHCQFKGTKPEQEKTNIGVTKTKPRKKILKQKKKKKRRGRRLGGAVVEW